MTQLAERAMGAAHEWHKTARTSKGLAAAMLRFAAELLDEDWRLTVDLRAAADELEG